WDYTSRMVPASQFGARSTPRASVARLLSLVAVLVVLYGALIVAVDLRREPGRDVGVGAASSGYCSRMNPCDGFPGQAPGGGGPIECRYVPGDPHVPQRVAVGLGAIVVASILFIAAANSDPIRHRLA